MAQRLPLGVICMVTIASIHLVYSTTVQPTPSTSAAVEFPKHPTGCSGEFGHRCKCGTFEYHGKNRAVTNCTNTSFTDDQAQRVLQQISPDTEVLIFTGNSLSSLPPNVFGTDTVYERLRVVDFSNNKISTIQGQALHRIPNIERLILNDNFITFDSKHPRLFATVPDLKELHLANALNKTTAMSSLPAIFNSSLENLSVLNLANNGIGPGINKDRFCVFPLLKVLNLSNNSLMHLVWNTSCLPKLMNLDLSYNRIAYLQQDTMNEMDTVSGLTVKLEGNLFQCDCNMLEFHHWLHETEVHVPNKETFTCYDGFPINNTNVQVLSLQEGNLQCKDLTPYVAPRFGFLHIILVIVAVILVLVIVAFMIFNRKNIVKAARVTFSPVTRRMQYSAIKKDTETREVEL